MQPKYSVIIPVYNAEKTIKRCLDSLLAQNCDDAEIILINDGSQDSSGTICKEYAEREESVHYIEQQNAGVSAARNAGLDAARGEFVLFVDSDDYVFPCFFGVVEKTAESTPCDFVIFSSAFFNGKQLTENRYRPVRLIGRNDSRPHIIDAICNKVINGPCAKLYRRSIIEKRNIRFPEGVSVAEDRVFNIKYSLYIQSFEISDEVVYCVNTENDRSLSRGRHDDLERQFEINEKFFQLSLNEAPNPEVEKEEYRRAYNFGKCRAIYHDAKLLIQDQIGWFSRQKHLGELCDKINRKQLKYPKTRYCKLLTLPVRLRLTWLIDMMMLYKMRRG